MPLYFVFSFQDWYTLHAMIKARVYFVHICICTVFVFVFVFVFVLVFVFVFVFVFYDWDAKLQAGDGIERPQCIMRIPAAPPSPTKYHSLIVIHLYLYLYTQCTHNSVY